ncbi:hypothetical protein, partial [Variovorax sp. YR752]|uniref:DUF7482 domain-containing protein n=1 Tax=Variovorax sp. YR752 TaxID=1884383 RepID=UPI003137D218
VLAPARHAVALMSMAMAALAGCATPQLQQPAPITAQVVQMPLQRGWFDGEVVFYVTTDVSDAEVAAKHRANFAPRLADALPRDPVTPGQPSSVDKVYAVTNFEQGSVFASAPLPMGPSNRDRAYSPLWRMITVTWAVGQTPRQLASEEQVLAAAESGAVRLQTTNVVLNCPIVHRGSRGGLDGVSLPGSRR